MPKRIMHCAGKVIAFSFSEYSTFFSTTLFSYAKMRSAAQSKRFFSWPALVHPCLKIFMEIIHKSR
jgi:hypothetical protein